MARTRSKRILLRVLWSLGALIVLLVVGTIVWSQVGVMGAEPGPLAEAEKNSAVTIEQTPEGVVISPADGDSEVGLVFVPGAKVQPEGYISTLQGLAADDGITVVITRPWLNLAFFDPRGLDAFTSAAPEIGTWIVGGHSLGGVRACQLAPDADALALFASYCANDLSASALPVLSLSGSEDGLSTPQKIADARHLLPESAELIEIDGASHASFGAYGPQAGDGTPTIPDDDVRAQITESVGALAAGLD